MTHGSGREAVLVRPSGELAFIEIQRHAVERVDDLVATLLGEVD
jgi:hypothetical protein